ncbi:MAG: pseudouridine synthase [Planctomycetota bacterium]|nr:pseudouridine synthase [Planctomycetota bacterium]
MIERNGQPQVGEGSDTFTTEAEAMPGANGRPARKQVRRVRLQRVLADAGVAARRVCEEFIVEGRVSVNGRLVRELPAFVDPTEDEIRVDGRVLQRARVTKSGDLRMTRPVVVMLNKPARTISTAADEMGMDRRTVAQLVKHPSGARLFPVGRLDYETTGLMLLTNDGELANRLTHPRYNVSKTYEVLVKDALDETALSHLSQELNKFERRARKVPGSPAEVAAARARMGSGASQAVELRVVRREPGKTLLEVVLREARNRQVRQMLAAAGLNIKKIHRTAIGPLRLRELASGSWRELEREELKLLRNASKGVLPREPRRPTRSRPSGARSNGARSRDERSDGRFAPPRAELRADSRADRRPEIRPETRPEAGPDRSAGERGGTRGGKGQQRPAPPATPAPRERVSGTQGEPDAPRRRPRRLGIPSEGRSS